MSDLNPNSVAQLTTVHPDLVKVVVRAAAWCDVPFEVSQGARTVEQQREYFQRGNSKVNPDAYPTKEALYRAAKHVVGPGEPLSRAVDIFTPKQPDGSYDKHALCYVAGVMRSAAQSLGVGIRWGGDFDQDGLLLEAGTFHDLPHFEIQ